MYDMYETLDSSNEFQGDMHEGFNHAGLSELLKGRTDWILCYNDCQYIRDLYKDCKIEKVCWAYGMNSTKESSEVLIFPS